jgi:hypothetical protein
LSRLVTPQLLFALVVAVMTMRETTTPHLVERTLRLLNKYAL